MYFQEKYWFLLCVGERFFFSGCFYIFSLIFCAKLVSIYQTRANIAVGLSTFVENPFNDDIFVRKAVALAISINIGDKHA